MDLIDKSENGSILRPETAQKLEEFEEAIKRAKEMEDEIKQAILIEMEAKGILKVETERITITYIAETTREIFDSKKFRKDNPDMYDDYIRISTVKPSLRVRVK